jgi:transcriptional regulator with XRE-family HTH domain
MPDKRERGPKRSVRFDTARLLRARHAAVLTQLELSDQAGISVDSVWRAEHGEPISVETAMAIGAALNILVERLLHPETQLELPRESDEGPPEPDDADLISSLDPNDIDFKEIEVRLSDTWDAFLKWLETEVGGVIEVREDSDSAEPSFDSSGKFGQLTYRVVVSAERRGIIFRHKFDLINDWLHPLVLNLGPTGAYVTWDTSLWSVKLPDTHVPKMVSHPHAKNCRDAVYWVLFAKLRAEAPQSSKKLTVDIPAPDTDSDVSDIAVPPDIRDQIESAESYEAMGDAWSAYAIYGSVAAQLDKLGMTDLATAMRRRMKANVSAAASIMRGF